MFTDISLTVRSGEIVALSGLVGAGRSEVARAVFGIDRYDAGTVTVRGKRLKKASPTGAMTAGVGFVPEDRRQHEWEVIGARVKEAYDKLIASGKYTGGLVPFGYRPVKLDKNWGYEKDPMYAPIVAAMAERFVERYDTLGGISRWLRETGVDTPVDVMRVRSSNPKTREKYKTGRPWTNITVRKILSSPAILGAVVKSDGTAIRDEQGMVIYRADPLITRDQFEKIQLRLSQNGSPVRVNSSPLLQIAFCAQCGSPVHRTAAKSRNYDGGPREYNYYVCPNSNQKNGLCDARLIRAEPLEDIVFGTLLELAGDRLLRTERLVAGRDYSEEIARIIEQTSHLQTEISRARNGFLRQLGIRVVVHKERLPTPDLQEGPMTALDIARSALIDRPEFKSVLHLGNLGDLLRAAGDLAITIQEQ